MSRSRVLSTRFVECWDEHGCDDHRRIVSISLNARDRKNALHRRSAYIKHLEREFIIQRTGCRCSHCLMDFDCCGRLFPAYNELKPAPHGVFVIQHMHRNI